MSPFTNGVALYTIKVGASGTKSVTLVESTPRQFITLRDDVEKGHEQRIWQVSYNAKTGIVTMKNAATGNYATVNDMTHYVVGDKRAQEFKLVVMRQHDSGDWVAIQEKDSNRMWTAYDETEGSKIQARIIPDPKTSYASWWMFTLVPGVASEGEEREVRTVRDVYMRGTSGHHESLP